METGGSRRGNPGAVDPDNPYRPTWIDRYGPDGVLQVPIILIATVGGVGVLGALVSLLVGDFAAGWLILPSASVITAVVGSIALYVVDRIGRSAGAIAFAGGPGYEDQFSYEDALAIRGDVAGAIASFEDRMAATPLEAGTGVELRVRAAEMNAGPNGNPARAAELFREIQRLPGLPVNRDLYVSNRLIDLYLGPLRDEGRALVELRRLADRYPGTAPAAGARAAIARLKKIE